MNSKRCAIIIAFLAILIILGLVLWWTVGERPAGEVEELIEEIPEEKEGEMPEVPTSAPPAECTSDDDCEDADPYTTDVCDSQANVCLYYLETPVPEGEEIECKKDIECDDNDVFTWDFCSADKVCGHYNILRGRSSRSVSVPVSPAPAIPPQSLPNHCVNNVWDGDESDLDCGGSCNPCQGPPNPYTACWTNNDCISGACDLRQAVRPLPANNATGRPYTIAELQKLAGQSWIMHFQGSCLPAIMPPTSPPPAPLPVPVPIPMPPQPGPIGITPAPSPAPTPTPPNATTAPAPSPAPGPAPSPTPSPVPTPTPVPNATTPTPPAPYPAHCTNLQSDNGESDWNCGGPCPPCPPQPPFCDDVNFPSPWGVPCAQHLSCWTNSDCATGNCDMSGAQPLPAVDPNTGKIYNTTQQLRQVGQSWVIPYQGLCK